MPGPFGAMAVGVPFAAGAETAQPGVQIICLDGDCSFGQNAMELDTAVRHKLPLLCVTSLNGARGASFALRLTSRRRCYSLLFPKNTAGSLARAADFLAFGETVKQNNSEKQRTKTARKQPDAAVKRCENSERNRLGAGSWRSRKNILTMGGLYTRRRQFSDRPSRFAQISLLNACYARVRVGLPATEEAPWSPQRQSSITRRSYRRRLRGSDPPNALTAVATRPPTQLRWPLSCQYR